jgi:hypothetical protein
MEREDGEQREVVMREKNRADAELELLLRQMKDDLQSLPRHEWDGYLWALCRTLVEDGVEPPAAARPPADGERV